MSTKHPLLLYNGPSREKEPECRILSHRRNDSGLHEQTTTRSKIQKIPKANHGALMRDAHNIEEEIKRK